MPNQTKPPAASFTDVMHVFDQKNKSNNRSLNERQNKVIAGLTAHFMQPPTASELQHARENHLETQHSLNAMADSIEVNSLAMEATIDPYTIYCSKTGQPVGRCFEKTIAMMVKVRENNLSSAASMLAFTAQTTVAQHWIDTSPAALDRLLTIDPAGFFVYAASICIARPKPTNEVELREQETANFQQNFLQEKIELYNFLSSKITTDALLAANSAFIRAWDTFDPRRIKMARLIPNNSLRDFMSAEAVASVAKNLGSVIAGLLKADVTRRVQIHPEDIARLKSRLGSVSNFHISSKRQFHDNNEYLEKLLHDFNIGASFAGDTRQADEWRQKQKPIAFNKAGSTTLNTSGLTAASVSASTLQADKPKLTMMQMLELARAKHK